MPTASGLRRVLSSSLSIGRTLNVQEKSFTFLALKKQPLVGAWPQAGWSVSAKLSYQQNFPTSHSGARGRGLPPVQLPPPGTAPPFFRLIKPPVEGRKILLIRHNPSLTSYSAKKCAVKDGDFCSLHFSLGRFFEPQTGGTTHPRNRGFFTGEGRLRGARGE
jgi:hypothetical protein